MIKSEKNKSERFVVVVVFGFLEKLGSCAMKACGHFPEV